VKTIDNAYLLDVSPDATKLCIYSTKNPYDSFSWSGTWKQLNNPVPEKDDALRIFDIRSWEQVYSTVLRHRARQATFFTEGEMLYVDADVPGKFIQRVLLNWKMGNSKEHVDSWVMDGVTLYYFALSDSVLLGRVYNSKTNRTDAFVRAELPDYKESKRVPFAEKRVPPPTGMTETPISISGNRKAVVYTVDNRVIYRRTDDLEIVWQREIETKKLLFRSAISFDGQLVAVCVGTGFLPSQTNPDIFLFDGRDGTPGTRVGATLEVEALAISPDHRLLAIAENLPPPRINGNTQANVILFDTGTGKELARVIHDEFRPRKNPDHSIRADGLRFTSDGKYLVSSGLHTKVWEIS